MKATEEHGRASAAEQAGASSGRGRGQGAPPPLLDGFLVSTGGQGAGARARDPGAGAPWRARVGPAMAGSGERGAVELPPSLSPAGLAPSSPHGRRRRQLRPSSGAAAELHPPSLPLLHVGEVELARRTPPRAPATRWGGGGEAAAGTSRQCAAAGSCGAQRRLGAEAGDAVGVDLRELAPWRAGRRRRRSRAGRPLLRPPEPFLCFLCSGGAATAATALFLVAGASSRAAGRHLHAGTALFYSLPFTLRARARGG
ncbi:unnamed protein product [Urochloa humidicola]